MGKFYSRFGVMGTGALSNVLLIQGQCIAQLYTSFCISIMATTWVQRWESIKSHHFFRSILWQLRPHQIWVKTPHDYPLIFSPKYPQYPPENTKEVFKISEKYYKKKTIDYNFFLNEKRIGMPWFCRVRTIGQHKILLNT